MKSNITLPNFDSMAQMSAALDIPLGILKLAKRNGCTFVQHGRCNTSEFIRWFFAQNPDDADQINWASRGKRAKALLDEHKLEREKANVVDRALLERVMSEVVGKCVSGELDRLANELPAVLKGKSETDISSEVKRQKGMIRDSLFATMKKWCDAMRKGASELPA